MAAKLSNGNPAWSSQVSLSKFAVLAIASQVIYVDKRVQVSFNQKLLRYLVSAQFYIVKKLFFTGNSNWITYSDVLFETDLTQIGLISRLHF